jgi:hypothetical protein
MQRVTELQIRTLPHIAMAPYTREDHILLGEGALRELAHSHRFLAVLLALLLGGCDLTASQERETDANICTNYGFRPGTTEFAQCQMSRDQQRQANNRALIEQIARNNQQPAYQVVPAPTARPAVNCTTLALGGGLAQTTCQ